MEIIVLSIVIGVLVIVSAVSIAFSGWVVVKVYLSAATLAASQHDAGAKYSTSMLSASEALSRAVDGRVSDRVKLVNAVARGVDPSPTFNSVTSSLIADAPLPPQIRETGQIDDLHEIERDLKRYRREGSDDILKRDFGVGYGIDEL